MGSFHADLLDFAHQHADWWLFGDGQLNQRVLAERLANKELWDLLDREYIDVRITAARDITIRALQRGEAMEGTSPSMVAEMLVSTISVHFNYTTLERRAELHRKFHEYAEKLVDTIVRAVGVNGPRKATPAKKTTATKKPNGSIARPGVAKSAPPRRPTPGPTRKTKPNQSD